MKFMLSVVLLCCSNLAFASPELKGSPEELRQFLHPSDRLVTINADAEEKAYSDKAIVSLVITTENKQLSKAIADNGKQRETISQKLIKAGIEEDAIKSSKFSTSPQYGWFGQKPNSYKVVNRMAISITDENHLKEIATVADASEEVELSDTSFEHSKEDEYKNRVKQQALAKVMQQKEFYEKQLGVKLTPIGFRDSLIDHLATPGAMMLEETILAERSRLESTSTYASVGKTRLQQPRSSSFDEVIYRANISVDFKIVPPAQ
ncbi:MAG: DUF541 domain-containing protein [Gammaproteobacteria bacterium]|nr:MAG: DUF541 domain-containing protein [Gammaproteobacteria bacterium]